MSITLSDFSSKVYTIIFLCPSKRLRWLYCNSKFYTGTKAGFFKILKQTKDMCTTINGYNISTKHLISIEPVGRKLTFGKYINESKNFQTANNEVLKFGL